MKTRRLGSVRRIAVLDGGLHGVYRYAGALRLSSELGIPPDVNLHFSYRLPRIRNIVRLGVDMHRVLIGGVRVDRAFLDSIRVMNYLRRHGYALYYADLDFNLYKDLPVPARDWGLVLAYAREMDT